MLAAFCETRPEYQDVLALCTPVASPESDAGSAVEAFGYVYLLKSGRFFKIGRSNAVGRREYELAIQLPEKYLFIAAATTRSLPICMNSSPVVSSTPHLELFGAS